MKWCSWMTLDHCWNNNDCCVAISTMNTSTITNIAFFNWMTLTHLLSLVTFLLYKFWLYKKTRFFPDRDRGGERSSVFRASEVCWKPSRWWESPDHLIELDKRNMFCKAWHPWNVRNVMTVLLLLLFRPYPTNKIAAIIIALKYVIIN